MRTKLLVAASTLVWMTPAAGQSAERLLSDCKTLVSAPVTEQGIKLHEDFATGFCWGVFSALQRLVGTKDDRGRPQFGICPPKESTRSQYVTIFAKYADQHPERL